MVKRFFLPTVDRVSRKPRIWSNKELRQLAPLFAGDVINVSAWKDEDKEGGHYKDYFTLATSYTVSNWYSVRGFQGVDNEILLDLETMLPDHLKKRFDVVFNHTTLEHVFDVFQAFKNLCELSRDVVIVVVPFMQLLHYSQGYLDYWRFTPYTLRKLFEQNKLCCIYEAAYDVPNHSVYIVSIGSRFPEKWKDKISYQPRDWLKLGKGNVRNDIMQIISEKMYSLFYGRGR